MERRGRWAAALVVSLILAGGAAPVALFWRAIGRAPTVTPPEAWKELERPGTDALLLDVRPPQKYEAGHLEGAESWPPEEVRRSVAAGRLPDRLRGKTLFLICDSGIRSAAAALSLRGIPGTKAFSVRGGIQGWISAGKQPCGTRFCALRTASGESKALPFKETPRLEQYLAVLHAFVVKPLYCLMAFAYVVVLWRRREPDLSALKWATASFFLGEEACAANFLLFHDESYLFEYLHDFGMVLCFAFSAYALASGLDERLVQYSDPKKRCAFSALCRACIKHADVPCALERSFYFLLPAFFVLALMPLCVPIEPLAYNTEILGRLYTLSHPAIHQIFESRLCAYAALLLTAAALAVFVLRGTSRVFWSKLLLCAALGPLGFAFFRLLVYRANRPSLGWFNFWEEVTEFLYMAGVGVGLWLFRHGLFPKASEGAEEGLPQRHRGAEKEEIF